jgi:hypothetical protein
LINAQAGFLHAPIPDLEQRVRGIGRVRGERLNGS